MATLQVALPPMLRMRQRLPLQVVGRMAWTRRGDRLIASGFDLERRERDSEGAAVRDTLVVDAVTGEIVERWSGYWYCAIGVAIHDSYVAGANDAGFIDMWRFGRAQPGWPKQQHQGRIGALVFTADERRFFSGGDDGRVGAWSAGAWEARFWDVGAPVRDLAHDGARDLLAIASARPSVQLVDGGDGQRRGSVRAPGRATAVGFGGEGSLYVGTREGQLGRFDVERGQAMGASRPLGLGPVWRILPMGELVVVEAGDGVVIVDGKSGVERARWRTGAESTGATLAVEPSQRAFAVAVPAGVAIIDSDLGPLPEPVDVVALYHPSDGDAANVVLAHLTAAGARVSDVVRDPRALVAAARRGATAVVFYGPAGPAPRHDYEVDVLLAHDAPAVPIILPGGAVPEPQRVFHPASYVCFHGRLHDDDALARITRAVMPDRRHHY